MARRRFYARPDDIDDSTVTLAADETHHLTHVLRMTPGDEAFVFDGCGREYRCTFRRVAGDRAQLDVHDELVDTVESPVQITLAQALAKGEKFDFIIQKATELGVTRIAPLVTRYADVKLDDQQVERRRARWARISLEALKQCGRRKLVEIAAPRTVREFLDSVAQAASLRTETLETPIRNSAACATLLLFSERGGSGIADALAGAAIRCPVVPLVGPEGGWSDDELELFQQHGSKPVTLGPRMLRTETAAVVAITLIQHTMGDLSVRGAQ